MGTKQVEITGCKIMAVLEVVPKLTVTTCKSGCQIRAQWFPPLRTIYRAPGWQMVGNICWHEASYLCVIFISKAEYHIIRMFMILTLKLLCTIRGGQGSVCTWYSDFLRSGWTGVCNPVRPYLRPTQLLLQWVLVFSPGLNWLQCETDHSPPSSAKVDNEW